MFADACVCLYLVGWFLSFDARLKINFRVDAFSKHDAELLSAIAVRECQTESFLNGDFENLTPNQASTMPVFNRNRVSPCTKELISAQIRSKLEFSPEMTVQNYFTKRGSI